MAVKEAKLAENKIKPTANDVLVYIQGIEEPQKLEDSLVLLNLLKEISKTEPVLWSNSFIGFGTKIHKSVASGRLSEWMRIGFAARKGNLTLYFGTYINELGNSLEKLGKYKSGMGCLYIKKLSYVNMDVLKELYIAAWKNELGSNY